MSSRLFGAMSAGLLATTGASIRADMSRYPYDNFAHAGDPQGVYFGTAKDLFPLAANLNLDPTFTDAQKEVLRRAMTIFVERAATQNVIDCAYRNSTKDFPASRGTFENQLVEALVYRNLGSIFYPGYVYVARYWDEQDTVGRGYINLFYDKDRPLPGYSDRHYLHFAINSDHLGEGKAYHLAEDADYWAGVMAHEALHNLGYRHPTGYPGSFIKEYGICVWHNGSDREVPEGLLIDREIDKGM
ncbi:hypothetical protein WMF30_43740 [Sorangium sp. So ce134]